MSIEICHYCQARVDTDADEDCYEFNVPLCEHCRHLKEMDEQAHAEWERDNFGDN